MVGLLLLLSAKTGTPRGELRILWYNVENLFHPSDDSIAGDDEFTPEGVRHWTFARYNNKVTALAKVIVAAGDWDPPDMVGLCEVENGMVLEDLVGHPILEPYHYSYVHRESPDARGMDVACLFREKRIRLVSWETFSFEPGTGQRGTRDLLHVCGVWSKRDTLDLFLVHLISKYGGTGATAEFRKGQVQRLVKVADSVDRVREKSLKIMAGDFNEPYEGYSMEPLRNGTLQGSPITSVALEGNLGSYKYQGHWNSIDQFLAGGRAGPYHIVGSVMEHPGLLAPDESFGGVKPDRTYTGYLYSGGISDHLPVLLDISGRPFSIYFGE